MREIKIKALRVRQPIGDFFVGVISHKDLNEICYVDIRRVGNESELDSYIGIQRQVDPKRIKDIKEYVRTPDATFPSSIILAIDENCAEYNEDSCELTLREYTDLEFPQRSIPFGEMAKILDGQHRVKGLSEGDNYQLAFSDDDRELVFDLNVSIFVGADMPEQANVFATVNLAQTKVSKSLVYDLAELSRSRSPQQTAHNVAVVLDGAEKSPLSKLIKRLGVATPGRTGETLTQATVVESLLDLISDDPKMDRHVLKKGDKLPPTPEKDKYRLIFRDFFINERDEDIAKVVWSYFAAIRERWPISWGDNVRGNIIKRTNGFRAFMRFLPLIYSECIRDGDGGLVRKDQFLRVLERIDIRDGEFTIDFYPPGSSGESQLYKKLKSSL